ncbi:egg cell-secreted protein 1.1-like [Melia azedarach]|uniref:Egg cell-secreted protein 1.1-like n=1 Tax=Melia azedarach TaxID=155640 RepID=A0ACC1XVD9_MELAZ|nr:egg cell-secreted protein 1.1-like [Melia azedarach]
MFLLPLLQNTHRKTQNFNTMSLKNKVILLVLTYLIAYAAALRDLPIKPGYNLATRLDASGGLVDCWNALLELKSCSNEIVLFFLNGQADIGPNCCRAISIITRNCWPSMLISLGLTIEEGNILRGYCDASPGPVAASPVSTSAVSG